MGAQERNAFFSHLRSAVERAEKAADDRALLHRQALYLTSYDGSSEANSWTTHALHARRGLIAVQGGSPRWAGARSTATALARRGDPLPLLEFIDRSIADDDAAETANLNYWAYWLGALREPQPSDAFMTDRGLTGWDPVTLLRGLAQGFHESPGYADLYAHSLWALLTAHRWLPQASPALTRTLSGRVVRILETGSISLRSRRELGAVHYVLRDQEP